RMGSGSDHLRLQNSVLRNSHVGCSGPCCGCGYGNAVFGGGYGSEFINLEIYNNDGYAFYITGPDNLIENCNLHDNNGYGIHFYKSGSTKDVSNNIARNNRLWHNGHNNRNPAGSCGLILSSGNNNVAYNNVILDHYGCGIQIYMGTTNAQAYNNTIVGNVGA